MTKTIGNMSRDTFKILDLLENVLIQISIYINGVTCYLPGSVKQGHKNNFKITTCAIYQVTWVRDMETDGRMQNAYMFSCFHV